MNRTVSMFPWSASVCGLPSGMAKSFFVTEGILKHYPL